MGICAGAHGIGSRQSSVRTSSARATRTARAHGNARRTALRLWNVVVRGRRLASTEDALAVAGLTIGDHVRNVDIG